MEKRNKSDIKGLQYQILMLERQFLFVILRHKCTIYNLVLLESYFESYLDG